MRLIPRRVISWHVRPLVYVTAFLSICGPVSAISAFAQDAQNAATEEVSPSEDTTSKAMPVFRSESRQVLVGGTVCGGAPRIGEDEYDLFFRCHALRRRTRKDFRVFDNGIEQEINYVAEIAWGQDARFFHWYFNSTGRGTWLTFGDSAIRRPSAVYLLGFVPAQLATGECHTVKVSVRNGYMLNLGRNRYCNLSNPALSEATQEGTTLGSEMRDFASSTRPGTIDVSVSTYVFRSTGIVQLPIANSVSGEVKVGAPAFNYVVEARDKKAPARVVISAEFVSPQIKREYRSREWVLGLYIIGMVYAADGKLVAQFGDTYEGWYIFADSCSCEHYSIPRLYDTQVDLSPGTYELRVVVTDGKGHFGAARVPVHVEYLGGDLLSMSDLVVTDVVRNASEMLDDFGLSLLSFGVRPTPLVSSGFQFFPSLLHSSPKTDYSGIVGFRRLSGRSAGDKGGGFSRKDAVSLYFEIYDPLLEKESTEVRFEVRVTNVDTGEMQINSGPISAAKSVQRGNAVVPIAVGLDMKKLRKGSFKVEVRASDSAGRETPWQRAEFRVR